MPTRVRARHRIFRPAPRPHIRIDPIQVRPWYPSKQDKAGRIVSAMNIPLATGNIVSFQFRWFEDKKKIRGKQRAQAWGRGFRDAVYVVMGDGVLALEGSRAGILADARILNGRRVEGTEKTRAVACAGRILAASKRARKLLVQSLDQNQKADLLEHGWFVVRGSDGGRFKIGVTRNSNVTELDCRGRAKARFCIHTKKWMPDEDLMLAQKLQLEADEEGFKKAANVWCVPRKRRKFVGTLNGRPVRAPVMI